MIPVVILGVPILDTAFAFLRRVVRGRNFAAADREHLHHRLMRLGHGHRRAVTILWLWTAVLSGIVLVPTYDIAKGTLNFLMPFLLVVFGAAPVRDLRPRRPQLPEQAGTRPRRDPAPASRARSIRRRRPMTTW